MKTPNYMSAGFSLSSAVLMAHRAEAFEEADDRRVTSCHAQLIKELTAACAAMGYTLTPVAEAQADANAVA